MKRWVARSVDWIDDRLAAATLARGRERPALLGFVFHAVFESDAEIAAERMWPAQPLQPGELARFIEHFLAHGYRFVSPADLLSGLDPTGYYALLTFDDGYANNQRALPILRQYAVPATFFISARHVAEGGAFWWDVVYRERRRRGASLTAIRREVRALKRRRPADIEAALRSDFGAGALRPVSDTDRPFSAAELRAFAAEPLVTLGNHTATHADLTREDAAGAAAEIGECQRFLTDLTGRAPRILAYPDGACDARATAATARAGLPLAVTVGLRKTRLPLSGAGALRIDRAFVPCGNALSGACVRSRSDLRLRRWLEAARPPRGAS